VSGVVIARRGERIVLAEHPKRIIDRMHARLDAIAAEEDETTEACS
jgi:hypothetical protein